MPDNFPYDVFLSHNSADKPRVRRLAERLRAVGLRVWFDEWIIQPGDDIYLAIERRLEASRTLVLCLSPAALGSDWVGLEGSTVLFRDPANACRRFIPLLLADCDTVSRFAPPSNGRLTFTPLVSSHLLVANSSAIAGRWLIHHLGVNDWAFRLFLFYYRLQRVLGDRSQDLEILAWPATAGQPSAFQRPTAKKLRKLSVLPWPPQVEGRYECRLCFRTEDLGSPLQNPRPQKTLHVLRNWWNRNFASIERRRCRNSARNGLPKLRPVLLPPERD